MSAAEDSHQRHVTLCRPCDDDLQASSVERVAQMLNVVLALPPNWDGDGEKAVDLNAAERALDVYAALTSVPKDPPQVFALPSGGVQLEWLIDGHDLELEFTPGGQVIALGANPAGDLDLDVEIDEAAPAQSTQFHAIRDYFERITVPVESTRLGNLAEIE